MSCLLLLLAASRAFAADSLVANGGFEAATEVQGAPSSDIGFGLWTLGATKRVPADWALNPAYPGEVSVPSEGTHSGSGCLRLRANGSRGTAHVYQPCAAIKAGMVYVVSVWVRGGPVNVGFYEYWDDGRITIPTVVAGRSEGDAWRELRGYYLPAGARFRSASLAIMVPEGVTVDVDDVQVEESGGALPEGLEPIIMQTEWVRLVISPSGRLTEFTCLPTGTNYAVPDTPVFRLSRLGGETPVRYVKRAGDALEVHFADPELVATVKLEARPHYLTLTVDRVTG
ncbi:MAG: hypothetical protein FJX75_15490, partial [Armatimonadetes bacterium]|nr:hypothetical protein [Armatimonadota bacterium]